MGSVILLHVPIREDEKRILSPPVPVPVPEMYVSYGLAGWQNTRSSSPISPSGPPQGFKYSYILETFTRPPTPIVDKAPN